MASLNQVNIDLKFTGLNNLDQATKKMRQVQTEVKRLAKEERAGSISSAQYSKRVNQLATELQKSTKGNIQARNAVNLYSRQVRDALQAERESKAAADANKIAQQELARVRQKNATMTALMEQRLREEAKQAREVAAADAALAREKDRLISKLNPLRSASMLYENELRDINEATRLGAINDRQRQQSLDALNNEFQAYNAGVQGAAMANNRFAVQGQQAKRSTNQLGVLMQQTGYQVGDFAVQVQGGTNVMVAFGQQATQLVGTFGMLAKSTRMIGVFAGLGIAIPILTAIGAAFMRMKAESDTAAASVKKLDDAMQSLDSTLNDWITSKKASEAGVTTEQLLGSQSVENAIKEVQEARGKLESLRQSAVSTPQTFGLAGGASFIVNLVQQKKATQDLEGATDDLLKAEIRLANLRQKNAEERASNFAGQSLQLKQELDIQRLISRNGQDSAVVRNAQLEMEIRNRHAAIDAQVESNELNENAAAALKIQVEELLRLTDLNDKSAEAADKLEDSMSDVADRIREAGREALTLMQNLRGAMSSVQGTEAGIAAAQRAANRGASEADVRAVQAAAETEANLSRQGFEGTELQQAVSLSYETARREFLANQAQSELYDRFDTSTSKSGSGQSDFERDLENAQKIFDGLYDSAEAYRGRLESIQLQYQSGEITLQQYTDAMEQLKEATADGTYVMESAQQALIDYSANAVKYGDEIANALTSAFKGAEDALTDFVMTGKLDFNDLANSIVADITRIAIRSAILGPLASSLGGALGGGGGLGSMLAGVFHNGGIVGAGGNAGRKISATAFIGAPRFHDGGMVGLRPNEVPAILERGEKVIPKDKVDKGGSVTVNMTINTPDANSFRRSENQVASMARMALQRAQRNM